MFPSTALSLNFILFKKKEEIIVDYLDFYLKSNPLIILRLWSFLMGDPLHKWRETNYQNKENNTIDNTQN
jgi:hypothetical protein